MFARMGGCGLALSVTLCGCLTAQAAEDPRCVGLSGAAYGLCSAAVAIPCDGGTYSNACDAAALGVNVDFGGRCPAKGRMAPRPTP